ncbi:modulator protein [Treponema denticola]|uniref:metallopeptidase TldD-related protein n=1 Tax=Treponema denticola TaxID=158 RepID=UPI0020A2F124|nr:metallopeptidase TldD-related protein [Treponema denticola]UTC97964.1 modulator protein [Treponema denticola]
MKDKIISILKNKNIDGYRLVLTKIKSGEMFLVRDKMDMNRAKNVLHTSLTVYKDFEEAGKKYRGSADVNLSPTMDEEEINKKIEEAAFAAQFVKNEWYPLSRPSSEKPFSISSSFDTENLNEELVKIQKAIYKKRDTKAEINSTEIFIDNMEVQIVNSEGVDVRFKKYKGYIEVITDCSIGKEEVEIYGDNSFSTESEKLIDNMVSEQLKETEERALAEKAKHLKSVNVIITNTAAASFFDFYISQASASMVYTKSSAAKLGENFQGSRVKGDKVNIKLVPNMAGSPYSAPYDGDGFLLKEHELYKDGIVKTYHGSIKFAHYLNVEPTGNIVNFEVGAGAKTEADLKKEPYVEILTFSDFFQDEVTGDFGGEFRLARYFDGKALHIINNGSISGNMFDAQKEFYFSKERVQHSNYFGPKSIMIPNMEVLGD